MKVPTLEVGAICFQTPRFGILDSITSRYYRVDLCKLQTSGAILLACLTYGFSPLCVSSNLHSEMLLTNCAARPCAPKINRRSGTKTHQRALAGRGHGAEVQKLHRANACRLGCVRDARSGLLSCAQLSSACKCLPGTCHRYSTKHRTAQQHGAFPGTETCMY